MRRLHSFYCVQFIAIVIAAGLAGADPARAQSQDDPASLGSQVIDLMRAGRYADAEVAAKRALAATERQLGPEHPAAAVALTNLAHVYVAIGKLASAEPLLKRALAVTDKALGPQHPDVGAALDNLARLYRAQGRAAEAEELAARARVILGPARN